MESKKQDTKSEGDKTLLGGAAFPLTDVEQSRFDSIIGAERLSLVSGPARFYEFIGQTVQVMLQNKDLYLGDLVTYDVQANVTLQNCRQRFVCGSEFTDVPRGVLTLRGDDIVLLGSCRCAVPDGLTQVSWPHMATRLDAIERQAVEQKETKTRIRQSVGMGFYDDMPW
eukprot:gnl/Dysnectes_brevis/3303_a4147_1072.p1 GENE.gnl/Dysnectes_brevis/3303_a4147_1072~~gnl/Dysnectes_brevis/3303_a4147_1072.p1  ORF type:complete len:169 (-),score=30.05 gnl/Dysnectes_brevis/3303_a4147_1072:60-566(-)